MKKKYCADIVNLVLIIASLTCASAVNAAQILYIGDSHSGGTYGKILDAQLRTLPNSTLNTYASCGSAPIHWLTGKATQCGYWHRDPQGNSQRLVKAPTPILAELLQTIRPTHILIALGSNQMHSEWLNSIKETELLLQKIPLGTHCIWLGPPHMRKFAENRLSTVTQALKDAAQRQRCHFADNLNVRYPDQGGDGIHFDTIGPAGRLQAQQWAQSNFNIFKNLFF